MFVVTIKLNKGLGAIKESIVYEIPIKPQTINLNLNVCSIPSLSFAPLNCDMKIPPEAQIVFIKTKKTKLICPAIFTPDIFMSPRPATIKLSTRDTKF